LSPGTRGERPMAARFVTSAPTVEQLPQIGMPEIAFAGRSNVGKSSLLGAVLRRPRLVRTSRTPGRTQLLNLFSFEERIALVDLPGYGYAKLSKTKRKALNEAIHGYIAERSPLLGVVLLLDARRESVTDDDRRVVEWVLQHERGLLVTLTKIDLVPKNKRLHHARRLEKALGIPAGRAVACSGQTGEGRDDLVAELNDLVAT
jgi:GTP-binding protein